MRPERLSLTSAGWRGLRLDDLGALGVVEARAIAGGCAAVNVLGGLVVLKTTQSILQ
jgi:hypothetical protein